MKQTAVPSRVRFSFHSGKRVLALPSALIALLAVRPVHAVDVGVGELEGRLDTTVSVGASWRTEGRNDDLVGVVNGGRAYSINGDNGNLNYDRGDPVSAIGKVTQELDLDWRNFGFFGRALYYYDWVIMDKDPARTSLPDAAEDEAGTDLDVLDAYVTADFDLMRIPVTLRYGDQVLSWGESTFIQNGINVINPVDVSRLRVAGAELREALIPVRMVSVSAGLTENLSVEAFRQLKWENTEIEPQGTFFSTSDNASPGGNITYLGFGLPPITDDPPTPVRASPPIGAWVGREQDREPSDAGQGGVAVRYFAPDLNETEFGLYFIRYHSRLPLLSGRTGDPAPKRPKNLMDLLGILRYGTYSGDYASTAGYYREFPEDIEVLGASFNTAVDDLGLAVQGEVSYRWDQPLQADDVELLYAAISPMDDTIRYLKQLEALFGGGGARVPKQIFANSQLGKAGFDEEVRGWRRKDMVQPQMTVTKLLGPTFGADEIALLAEAGATWVLDMEDESELRYEGPGTFTSGNPFFTELGIQPETQEGGFADDFSWGYRLAARATFNNALGPVGLEPGLAFYHDVNGTTPLPVANFVEGRQVLTASLGASYLNALKGSVAYTANLGGADFNLLRDRDFVSVTMSYSF